MWRFRELSRAVLIVYKKAMRDLAFASYRRDSRGPAVGRSSEIRGVYNSARRVLCGICII